MMIRFFVRVCVCKFCSPYLERQWPAVPRIFWDRKRAKFRPPGPAHRCGPAIPVSGTLAR